MSESRHEATPKIRRVALTGGIASGKSLVGEYLKSQDIPVIDADDVVHTLLREDDELKVKIRSHFGKTVFREDGTINRPALGAIVFRDPEKRQLLESWIHPKTRETIEKFFQQHQHEPLGVAIIPLLLETGTERHYDEVWLLEADEAQQIERLMTKRNMTREEAQARLNSQMPLSEKRQRVQQHGTAAILDNRGTPEALLSQVESLLRATPAKL